MFVENKIKYFEKDICKILSQLVHHIHPKIIEVIQKKNNEEFVYFEKLFGDKINVNDYLFEGSACVFPGVKRYVSGKGKKKSYNPEFKAIIDDNTFPRHLWCFLENGKTYNGPNWRDSGLGEFELAHIFTHKQTELTFEQNFFSKVDSALDPSGDFSCACNVVLLPKGTVRPTDNSEIIKAVFYKRYIELYGESPLNGRSDFIDALVPSWYCELKWNLPVLPSNWEVNLDKLLTYRTDRLTKLLNKTHPKNISTKAELMDWRELLNKIKTEVPEGRIITYKELALWAFGKPTGTQAIVAMLKAAVNDNSKNAIYTNRVVPESGNLSDPNGQISQLITEGVPVSNKKIEPTSDIVIRFTNP